MKENQGHLFNDCFQVRSNNEAGLIAEFEVFNTYLKSNLDREPMNYIPWTKDNWPNYSFQIQVTFIYHCTLRTFYFLHYILVIYSIQINVNLITCWSFKVMINLKRNVIDHSMIPYVINLISCFHIFYFIIYSSHTLIRYFVNLNQTL